IIAWLEKEACGTGVIRYRLRDWLFSRQRYWGEPFPIVHLENGEIVPLPEDALPVELPRIDEFKPTEDGRPPLARASAAWLNVKLPDGRTGTRETNTMPQWAGSCWYYLRFVDPNNGTAPWDPQVADYWLPVDLYVGGVEHAVLHLLYARFWHKVLYDCGLVKTKEPFPKLFNQGMILAMSFRDARGKYYLPEQVEKRGDGYVVKGTDTALQTQVEKMSKSKLNVVSPDDVIEAHGADAMRLYELFMGPLDQPKPWQMDGVEGVARFLARVWRLAIDERSGEINTKLVDAPGSSEQELWKMFHKTAKKVTEDTERLQFNTAISQMMVFVNTAYQTETLPKECFLGFLFFFSPYAPHLCEELWSVLGQKGLISLTEWPAFDPALAEENTVSIVVQVNGKRREVLDMPRDTPKAELEKAALSNEKVLKFMEGKAPKKVIVVPNRLVNIVV
ncbi:MAG: class I tRNA ligase family protein, partial [Bdellovibrionales bacterium]|nr:class I tRNA ligase family protein [Bdellovibrionales bacterium]